jgi:hypothetical protein
MGCQLFRERRMGGEKVGGDGEGECRRKTYIILMATQGSRELELARHAGGTSERNVQFDAVP